MPFDRRITSSVRSSKTLSPRPLCDDCTLSGKTVQSWLGRTVVLFDSWPFWMGEGTRSRPAEKLNNRGPLFGREHSVFKSEIARTPSTAARRSRMSGADPAHLPFGSVRSPTFAARGRQRRVRLGWVVSWSVVLWSICYIGFNFSLNLTRLAMFTSRLASSRASAPFVGKVARAQPLRQSCKPSFRR